MTPNTAERAPINSLVLIPVQDTNESIGRQGKYIAATDLLASSNNGIISGTIAQIRGMVTALGRVYVTTDNEGGVWVDIGLDDGVYVDDGVNYIISSNGRVLARNFSYTMPVYSNDYFDDGGAPKGANAVRIGNLVTGIICEQTGQLATYVKVTTQPEGFDINDGWIDGIMYRKKGSEMFLKSVGDGISVRDFQAKGDAVYFEQDAGPDFGKVTQRDHVTLATDDTTAFKKAVDFIHNYSLPTFAQIGGSSIGYRTKKLKLIIPAGSYLITEPEVFTKFRSAVTAYSDAGFIIQGDGQNATEIIFRNDGDATKFLIENNDAWNGLVVKDLSIKCVLGTEKVYHETSSGTAGFTTFENVGFENYKVAVQIDGSLNADRGTYRNVTAASSATGNVFFKISNPQAIGNIFDHVSIRVTNGIVFDVYATGSNTIQGASSIELFGSSCLYKINPVDLGEQENPAFTSYSTKIEMHGTSIFADIKGAFINVYSSNHNTNYSTAPYSVILRNSLAGVRFFESEFREFRTAILHDEVLDTMLNKPTLEYYSCRFRGTNWIAINVSYFESDFTTIADTSIANVGFTNPIFYDATDESSYKLIANRQIQFISPTLLVSTSLGVNNLTPTALVHAVNGIDDAASIKVENTSTSIGAQADFRAINDGHELFVMGIYSSVTATYKVFQSNGGLNYATGAGGIGILAESGTVRIAGNGANSGLVVSGTSVAATIPLSATQFMVSALNTAPASATAAGTLGEIRITAGFIYVCIAANTWVRAALVTW